MSFKHRKCHQVNCCQPQLPHWAAEHWKVALLSLNTCACTHPPELTVGWWAQTVWQHTPSHHAHHSPVSLSGRGLTPEPGSLICRLCSCYISPDTEHLQWRSNCDSRTNPQVTLWFTDAREDWWDVTASSEGAQHASCPEMRRTADGNFQANVRTVMEYLS